MDGRARNVIDGALVGADNNGTVIVGEFLIRLIGVAIQGAAANLVFNWLTRRLASRYPERI